VSKLFFQFFLSVLLACCVSLTALGQLADHGKADLSQYAVGDESLDLSGTWEFYWNKLLTPRDFTVNQNPEFIYVPGSWHRQGNYSTLGFATYRLRLSMPGKYHSLALYFPIINSSARVWVNGVLREETGKVSDLEKNYRPKLSPTIISLPDNKSELEIIVQVSNYVYFSGGIAGVPEIDKSSTIFSHLNRKNGVENFFAGSLIAMFVYQLILYFLYHRGKPFLWLALICLGVALRTLIVHGGSFFLPNLFPFVPWEIWKKLEFGSVYAVVALFPLYIYHLFPVYAPKKVISFFVGLAAILCLAVLVTPQYWYGKLLDVSHVGLLAAFIYAVYSIGRAWKAGNQDARVILFGVSASFPFILLEILKNQSFFFVNIHFMYMVEMGVLVFLLFQVYLLANHYATSYKNLEALNLNLEKIVADRTGQLITANAVKDRLLSVMSHDIKSPLNSLRGILQIYNKGAVSKEEFANFTQHIENDLNQTTLLVENILYWTASQLKGVEVKIESFDLHLLIEENVQLFKTIAAQKKIVLQHDAEKQLIIHTDRNILNLVLRNLIANAIKFSNEGGMIYIGVSLTEDLLQIMVKDEGKGMDVSVLKSLQTPDAIVSTSGTVNEQGTGLGLGLCREYLKRVGGHLSIQSEKGVGSTITIVLPAQHQKIAQASA
jgi:signal transduction histidine kinase